MKTFPCKQIGRGHWGILAILAVFFCTVQWAAAQSPAGKAGNGSQRIQISAESLEADDAKKYAEFAGNVRAVQGETVIASDRLKIYYEGNPAAQGDKKETSAKNTGDAIQRIVASGNVKIRFDNMDAQASEAVYTTSDRILILSGPGAIIRKPDSGEITGNKIIIHRDDGRIRFEGGVEGFLLPGERGLN